MLRTAAGACATPAELPDSGDWIAAAVPGTLAGALRAAGRWHEDAPERLHAGDTWYRLSLHEPGPRTLRFEGLTPPAEIWLDGALLRRVESMFVAEEIEAELRDGAVLALCFRSLDAALGQRRGGRARWRPRLADAPNLRSWRTTLLGHMPGWCPPVGVVGPWRAVSAIAPDALPARRDVRLHAFLDGEDGVLEAELRLRADLPAGLAAGIEIAGSWAALEPDGPRRLRATLRLPGVAPWWPHTHGEPALHRAVLAFGEHRVDLGQVGFRSVALDRGADGAAFRLLVNGEPVFCRGASWTSASLTEMPEDAATLRSWLELAREAGLNMLRVSATCAYESDSFHALCDELGILVWQDFMFATLDYPADAEFRALALREVTQFLERTGGSPSLALLCGSSERAQSATMRGLPPEVAAHPLFDEDFPAAIARLRPDVPYTPDCPHGGALPFQVNAGCSHYYGVGAYLRPLEDARRAEVRFAAECLAFANVPAPATVRALGVPAVHHPSWKQRVPRDPGAAWDFEDVRDHYLALLYGADPMRLRYADPERYLALSRAVSADLMEAVFAEWRRPGSTCAGGLVWQFQDLWPGAGWGLVDSAGRPKAALHGLRRVSAPVQVLLTDEGVNGLAVHLLNETARPCPVRLDFRCLRHGAVAVAEASRDLVLEPRRGITLNSAALLGRFFDVNAAYRFGPASHDVVLATLDCAKTGATLSQAVHFPNGRALPQGDPGLSGMLERDGAHWRVRLRTERFAQAVHLDLPGFRPAAEWFHLPPGGERLVALVPEDPSDPAIPSGEVHALNAFSPVPCRSEDLPR